MSASAVFRLQAVGFSAEQVEALANFLDGTAASKADVAEVKADLSAVRSDLKADLSAVRSDLKAEIAAVRSDLKADVSAVRSDLTHRFDLIESRMIALESRMTVKLGAMLVAAVGVAAAVVKFL